MSLSSSTPNVMEVDSVHLLHDLARFYDSRLLPFASESQRRLFVTFNEEEIFSTEERSLGGMNCSHRSS